MSLTTTCGPHLLQQRQQRPGRLGRVGAVLGVGVGRREHPVFLGRGEAEPGALDGAAPLLPGLDHDLVAARGQRPAEGDRREDVARVAEGGEQIADLRASRVRAADALTGPGEDDLRHVAVARGPQQEADRLADVLGADHLLAGDLALGELGHRRVDEGRAPAPCTGRLRRPPRGGSTSVKLITAALVAA